MAFIVPYLGRWPLWAELFFHSVKANPSVDVFVFCEFPPPFPLPPNVFVVETSRSAMLDRLRSATGLRLQNLSGHKLCDFKPFYGLCFADHLVNYEFWGFCDIDMMFGDLQQLLVPGFLEEIDIFTACDVEIVGHFTVLRNNDLMNRIGFEIEDWQAKCLRTEHVMVDERFFPKALAAHPEIRWGRPGLLEVELRKPFCRFGITFGFAGEVAHLSSTVPGLVEWHNGRVFYSDEATPMAEVLYVHFMGLKRWWHWLFFSQNRRPLGPDRFSRTGYGRPAVAEALTQFPWKQLYALQSLMQRVKSLFGRLSRRSLPDRTFLRIRRIFFGRGRY